MTATDRLLPCPFCGSEARTWHYYSGKVRVRCVRCGAITDRPFETMQEAADAWNTRAQGTCRMTEVFCGTASGVEWVCSACGSTCFVSEPMDTDEKPNYCPSCGRKVIG